MSQDYPKTKPYLFFMQTDGMDINFERTRDRVRPGNIPWGLYGDPDSEGEWKVLIFVRGDVEAPEIMRYIDEAQTYWREQTEIRFPIEDPPTGGANESAS